MEVAVLSVDLGKNVYSVVGLGASGAVVFPPARKARDVDWSGRKTAALHCPLGGLL